MGVLCNELFCSHGPVPQGESTTAHHEIQHFLWYSQSIHDSNVDTNDIDSMCKYRSGSNAFSMHPFFDSLNTANQHLFRSISIVARFFKDLPGSAMPITFLNGVKMFGENTADPLVSAVIGGGIFHKSFTLPLPKTSMDIMSSVFMMPPYMRLFVVSGSPLVSVNFIYHFVVDLIYRAVRAAYTPGVNPESVFYATMYNQKESFDRTITSNMHKACTGLSLAFGYTNPWARIIRCADMGDVRWDTSFNPMTCLFSGHSVTRGHLYRQACSSSSMSFSSMYQPPNACARTLRWGLRGIFYACNSTPTYRFLFALIGKQFPPNCAGRMPTQRTRTHEACHTGHGRRPGSHGQ